MVPTINVKHHFPHGRPHGLMETEPDLPSTSQRMVIALWSRKERSPHGGVPFWRKAKFTVKRHKDSKGYVIKMKDTLNTVE